MDKLERSKMYIDTHFQNKSTWRYPRLLYLANSFGYCCTMCTSRSKQQVKIQQFYGILVCLGETQENYFHCFCQELTMNKNIFSNAFFQFLAISSCRELQDRNWEYISHDAIIFVCVQMELREQLSSLWNNCKAVHQQTRHQEGSTDCIDSCLEQEFTHIVYTWALLHWCLKCLSLHLSLTLDRNKLLHNSRYLIRSRYLNTNSVSDLCIQRHYWQWDNDWQKNVNGKKETIITDFVE